MANGKNTPRGIARRAKATLTRFLPGRGNGSVDEPVGADEGVAPADTPPSHQEFTPEPPQSAESVDPPKPSQPPAVDEKTAAPTENNSADDAADASGPASAIEAAEEAIAELAAGAVAETPAEPAASKLIARRMGDPEYREEQYANRYEGRVAPINRLIDELVEESGEWMPYVAPVYGGTEARLLTLFRDPGPKTKVDKGSGMLSLENDDQSAERFLTFFEEAGMQVDDLMTWNTYPWYINRKPSTAEIDRGLDPLERIIALLPRLTVVMTHGGDAQNAWRRFERKNPAVAGKFLVIPTYHTSKQALFTPDPEVRAQREAKLRSDFARAAEHVAE